MTGKVKEPAGVGRKVTCRARETEPAWIARVPRWDKECGGCWIWWVGRSLKTDPNSLFLSRDS